MKNIISFLIAILSLSLLSCDKEEATPVSDDLTIRYKNVIATTDMNQPVQLWTVHFVGEEIKTVTATPEELIDYLSFAYGEQADAISGNYDTYECRCGEMASIIEDIHVAGIKQDIQPEIIQEGSKRHNPQWYNQYYSKKQHYR